MNRLLYISKDQFGYLTDAYKHCEILKDDFNIIYICMKSFDRVLTIPGIKVRYIKDRKNRYINSLCFFLLSFYYIFKHKGYILIVYFAQCGLFKRIFFWKKMILDIRSRSVESSQKNRQVFDNKIKKTADLYDHITIITKETQEKLNIDPQRSSILPLGADIISSSDKNFNEINLLYVGTLNNRNIEKTIEGLHLFLKHNDNYADRIRYNIVGEGNNINELKLLTAHLSLEDKIIFHGRVPHFDLKPFFDRNNIGVSYIPITEYYDHQPATKTYEYLLSGMPVIATKTYENTLIVNESNGVLINDNTEDFCTGLGKMISSLSYYDSDQIRQQASQYSWKNIVNSCLLPVLMKKELMNV